MLPPRRSPKGQCKLFLGFIINNFSRCEMYDKWYFCTVCKLFFGKLSKKLNCIPFLNFFINSFIAYKKFILYRL